MTQCLEVRASVPRRDRPQGFDDDVAFSEDLVASVLERYTRPGDVVFDPFLGFGTTVAVAERMGRLGFGLELLDERVAFVRGRVAHPERVFAGDARNLVQLRLPAVDFVLTSPPYMARINHPENPLNGYRSLDGDYDGYMRELALIFEQLKLVMKPGGLAAVNVANLKGPSGMTFLAWDAGRVLSQVMAFEREIPICWDVELPWMSQDYCLVFSNDHGAGGDAGGVVHG